MIKSGLRRYINNFKGFSREIWILAIITFVNRAGMMVLPFLSKYLKEDLGFSYGEVGWIMVSFGLGSMLGSWLGGKLTDKIGFYKIMVFSLFTSGILFISLQFIQSFWGLCAGMFVIMSVADMFRPAMFVSLTAYAKPENRTRALTLVRLAVNLGFSVGPALGGLIIMGVGYQGLFWVDGATCIIAISAFAMLVKEKKNPEHHRAHDATPVQSVFKDRIFWLFLFVCFVTSMIFFQLFTTLPLYHREQYNLTEVDTGLLLMLNGLLIFLLEMPIVSISERHAIPKIKLLMWGAVMMGLSFFVLLPEGWAGLLIFSIILMSFGEMFIFPFSNSFAMSRAPKGHEGRYMALFTMSFSLAHIMSSKCGMEIIDHFGYVFNWVFMGAVGVMAVGVCLWIQRLLAAENR
ncbi:MDR family MFS transporter [Flavobacterium caeni]|uniref:Predicted arabinose efflux permease, MFS family n=1 Tax=Flavobacterium caeni TaxID=490189 RepID=A0A1G5BLW3_9FLAO|nr:MFS transporter [Flavobacterium caeni]SCX91056.1 Predicted arabinose efflux permease, MFS family [Flavobacterium caeni]